jgi:hypothetical protein
MIVVSRQSRGNYGMGQLEAARSRSMIYPPNRARLSAAKQAAGGWTNIQLRGLGQGEGFMAQVPQWAWWAGGGLAAGLVAGFLFLKK